MRGDSHRAVLPHLRLTRRQRLLAERAGVVLSPASALVCAEGKDLLSRRVAGHPPRAQGAIGGNPDAARSFSSFQACIDFEAQFVRQDYLDPQGAFYHGSTLRGMNVSYATDPRWARNIAAIYLTLPGGLSAV